MFAISSLSISKSAQLEVFWMAGIQFDVGPHMRTLSQYSSKVQDLTGQVHVAQFVLKQFSILFAFIDKQNAKPADLDLQCFKNRK